MKKNIIMILLLFVISISLTGCFEQRKQFKIKTKEYTIIINAISKNNYTLSTKIEDLRSSREEGMLFGKDFSIGIDISNELSYEEYNNDFNKLKNVYKKEKEFKEVTYSGIKGFQLYNITFISYQIYLPVKNDKSKVLILSVYSKANLDEATKEIYNRKEIKDILNNVKIIKNKEK